MAGISAVNDLFIEACSSFMVVVARGILKLMDANIIDPETDHVYFAFREKDELVASFSMADGHVSPEESVWFDLDNTGADFEKRVRIDPDYWAKTPSDLFLLLAEHQPEIANQYAEHAMVLARAVCAIDGEVSAAEASLLSLFNQVLAAHSTISVEPYTAPGPRGPVAHHVTIEHDLEGTLRELDSLIGLHDVKAEVRQLANILHVRRMRVEAGLPAPAISLHLVFSGNPGTGKTTVARILGKVYAALGVLHKGHLVEISRKDIVAGYVGQTAIKTTDAFNSAIGGILFIDEAYSLNRGGQDFGQEAIDTLVKLMEDHRGEIVLIVAGYSDEMAALLLSNPGLPSRFKRIIHFPDYTDDELVAIFDVLAKSGGYGMTDDARAQMRAVISALPRDRNFGNGRLARQIFENAIGRHANRVMAMKTPSVGDLATLTGEDLVAV